VHWRILPAACEPIARTSGIVASSNVTVNVQRAHGIRERTLYLIECKHSVTPTGAHELRDRWRDINHGVYQLKLAMRILGLRLRSYLAGLFPGTTEAQSARLRIQPCVLCSHRVFSGLSLYGIPVRDVASLALTCGDGVVGMGAEDDSGHVVMQQYRLRANASTTQEDFDEYLADKSRFFEMFRPFMHEYDRLDRLFGGSVVLAYNTFVHDLSQEAWAAHLERIGWFTAIHEAAACTASKSLAAASTGASSAQLRI
jgi:hypothetical protein